MSGMEMHDITGMAEIADREGFAVSFPDGESGPDSLGPPWNVGENVCVASGARPSEALTVISENVPMAVGVLDRTPFPLSTSPGGKEPAVTRNVAAGLSKVVTME